MTESDVAMWTAAIPSRQAGVAGNESALPVPPARAD